MQIVCRQGGLAAAEARNALWERFRACRSETEMVMLLTNYHGLVALGGR